jgi:hypothetical protein
MEVRRAELGVAFEHGRELHVRGSIVRRGFEVQEDWPRVQIRRRGRWGTGC